MKPFFLVAGILLAELPVTASAGRKSLGEQLKASPHRIVHETYHNNNWELFTRNADGSDERNLTNTPGVNELYPQVSPDGERICFLVDTGKGRATVRSLWIMNGTWTDYHQQTLILAC